MKDGYYRSCKLVHWKRLRKEGYDLRRFTYRVIKGKVYYWEYLPRNLKKVDPHWALVYSTTPGPMGNYPGKAMTEQEYFLEIL